MTIVFAVAMGALVAGIAASLLSSRAGSLAGVLGCVLLVVVGVDAAVGGAHPVLWLGTWLGLGHDALRVDGLAGIFLALTGLTGAVVSFAGLGCPAGRGLTCLIATLLLTVAVVIATGNGFLFFLAWEGLTICVYLIASAGRSSDELAAGYLTGGLAKLGGAALLAATGLLYAHTHSFQIAVWSHAHLAAGTKGVLFALFLTCFATKIGALPLQGGLPAGYGAAPRLGAASLSVALCAGFYGLWRFECNVLNPLPLWCGDVFLVLGAITALTGIAYALAQDNLRRFLGYSTVEHAGIVLIGLGVTLLGQAAHKPMLAATGLLAATLHVTAHNLAKTLALVTVDRVELATGKRTIDPLGGLMKRLPTSAIGLGISSLTLAAIPPLGGFVSEWFTFEALLEGGFRMPTLLSQLLCGLAGAALALTAGLGLLAFAKFFSGIFLGQPRADATNVVEPSRWPAGTIGIGVVLLFLGTVAPWEIRGLGSGLHAVLGLDPAATTISYPLILTPVFPGFSVLDPTWLSVVLPAYAILAVIVARLMRGSAVRRAPVRRAPVWVTGSGATLAAVQYRPSAYSNPMRVILRGPLGYRTRVARAEVEDDFDADTARTGPDAPRARERLRLETSVVIAIERFLYDPAARLVMRIAALARAIQSGRLSIYLLYMLIALLAALSLVPILH